MSTPTPVVLIGARGMLASVAASVLGDDDRIAVTVAARGGGEVRTAGGRAIPVTPFDAEYASEESVTGLIGDARWVVNAAGVIKPYIKDSDSAQVLRAIAVNARFPHVLAAAAARRGARVLQIATDCVYSGVTGRYVEDAAHDALDVYGKTKSLGEAPVEGVHHLRCSIIGPEQQAHVSLLDWFLGQAAGARVNGFTNHHWNGVTTLHFVRACRGIIVENLALPARQHVLPSGSVSKYELLQLFARHFGRTDITVSPVEATTVIDRTLATTQPEVNQAIWASAGYAVPPDLETMVRELAGYVRGAGVST